MFILCEVSGAHKVIICGSGHFNSISLKRIYMTLFIVLLQLSLGFLGFGSLGLILVCLITTLGNFAGCAVAKTTTFPFKDNLLMN